MLLTVAVTFWLASSYIEYKIVSAYPTMEKYFRGVPGIVLSLAIGAALSFAVGASNAMPIVLAQMVGLATNEFMFKFFARAKQVNETRIVVQEKVMARVEQVKELEKAHPALVADVRKTATDGAKVAAVAGVGVLYALGTPAKAVRGTKHLAHGLTNVTKRSAKLGRKGFDKSKSITTNAVSGSVTKVKEITHRPSN